MSHYARLITVLSIKRRDAYKLAVVSHNLPVGTEIKNVEVFNEGYSFDARVGGGWVRCQTNEDLPAFTDKGSAHREEYAKSLSLRVGRPMRGESPMSERLVCKVSPVQQKWVLQTAAAHDTSVSEFVRKALISSGMPE